MKTLTFLFILAGYCLVNHKSLGPDNFPSLDNVIAILNIWTDFESAALHL